MGKHKRREINGVVIIIMTVQSSSNNSNKNCCKKKIHPGIDENNDNENDNDKLKQKEHMISMDNAEHHQGKTKATNARYTKQQREELQSMTRNLRRLKRKLLLKAVEKPATPVEGFRKMGLHVATAERSDLKSFAFRIVQFDNESNNP